MDIHLLLHNVGYIAGGIVTIALVLFVLWERRGRHDAFSGLFILLLLCVATFQFSHVLGVMAPDAETSRKFFMFNLANLGMGVFMVHWFLVLIGKSKERRLSLTLIYTSAAAMLIYFLLNPDSFLVESVPKLYLPNYYEPGALDWVMRRWLDIVWSYGLLEVFLAYRKSTDWIQRNRYWYVFIGVLYGVIVGLSAELLVYDIPFDPLISSLFGLYTLPLAYAVIRYELMDIKVAAKNAILYTGLVVAFSMVIYLSYLLDDFLTAKYPSLPHWVTPEVSAILAVIVAASVWKKFKNTDILKYEFVTIVSHKFRTPMTHIHLAATNLLASPTFPSDQREKVIAIEESNRQLIEMVSSLIDMAETEAGAFEYRTEKISINDFLTSIIARNLERYKAKGMVLMLHTAGGNPSVMIDKAKLEFVIQVLLDNAYLYTRGNGAVHVTSTVAGKYVQIQVKDEGVGISKDELPHIFKKFFRTPSSRQLHTEGMGIGLYLSRIILERSNGSIKVDSDGEGKGTEFIIQLPKV